MTTNLRRSRLVALAVLSCVGGLGGCRNDEVRYPSPDGRREVVIDTGRASVDNVWTVSVRDTNLFGAGQEVGCFTDDDPGSSPPTAAVWPSADEVSIATTAAGAQVTVKLNADGRWATTQAPDNFLAPCPYS